MTKEQELQLLIEQQKKDDTYHVRQNGTVPFDEDNESLRNGKLSKRRLIIPHGTETAYRWYKCRCLICTTSRAERARLYYLRKKAKHARR